MTYDYDVLLVLGTDLEPDGSLPANARSSVELAVQLYQRGIAPLVLFSGDHSYDHVAYVPPISEAQAMKDYARQLGLPATKILVETESKDTVGNAYFSKQSILLPLGLHRVAVLRGPLQSEQRMRYIFDTVFGPDFKYDLVPRPDHINAAGEARSLEVVRTWLQGITPGDDAALYDFLCDRHPAYGRDPTAVAALARQVAAL